MNKVLLWSKPGSGVGGGIGMPSVQTFPTIAILDAATNAPRSRGIGARHEVNLDGAWRNAPTGFAYQWNCNGVPIPGANGYSFIEGPGQYGRVVSVDVYVRNAYGSTQTTVFSAAAGH